MFRHCGNNTCEAVMMALPAFGAGVLLTLFLPPCILCGTCGAILLGAGIVCFLSK